MRLAAMVLAVLFDAVDAVVSSASTQSSRQSTRLLALVEGQPAAFEPLLEHGELARVLAFEQPLDVQLAAFADDPDAEAEPAREALPRGPASFA